MSKTQLKSVVEPTKNPEEDVNFMSSTWFIFSKKGCGYCAKAKEYLTNNNISFKETEVTDTNKNYIYSIVDKHTNKYRYFPMIFYKGDFLGGWTDLEKVSRETSKTK